MKPEASLSFLAPTPAPADPHPTADVEEPPATTRRGMATLAVLVALVVAAFEGTVVSTAMPTITRELGGMSLYAWVYAAFLLSSTLGVLVCGKLADGLGRKPVFVLGMALFLLGSVLCGLSTSIGALIAFRAVQGLGAGAIQPVAMTITADLYSLQERARIQALFTSVWGAANVLGPVLGGAIAMRLSWRWVFLVNVPFGLLAAALLSVSYKDPPRRAGVSGVGHALVAGAAAALAVLALEPSTTGTHGGWTARAPWMVAALLTTLVFVLTQRRARKPLLPLSLLPDRAVQTGLVSSVFVGGVLYAAMAYFPLWMTVEAHATPLLAGSALVALLVGWAFGSSFGVRVAVKHGMKASVGGGFTLALVGLSTLLLIVHAHASLALVFPALFVVGAGLGPAASTSLLLPQSHAPWQSRGAVTSVVYALRTLGGSLSVAALGAVEGEAGGAGHALDGASRFLAMAGVTAVAAAFAWWRAPRTSLPSRVGRRGV